MLSSSCLVSRPGPRNPLWLFMAAYASLGLRLTKFDFNVGSSDMLRSGVGRAAGELPWDSCDVGAVMGWAARMRSFVD